MPGEIHIMEVKEEHHMACYSMGCVCLLAIIGIHSGLALGALYALGFVVIGIVFLSVFFNWYVKCIAVLVIYLPGL